MAVTCVLICQAHMLAKTVCIVTSGDYFFMSVSLWCSWLCDGANSNTDLVISAITSGGWS